MKITFKRFKVEGIMELDDIRLAVAFLHIYFDIKVGVVQYFNQAALKAAVIMDLGQIMIQTYPKDNCTIIEIESCSKIMPARLVKKAMKNMFAPVMKSVPKKDFRINLYSPIAGIERGESEIVARNCGWDKIKIIRSE